jgi:hypothetical protein
MVNICESLINVVRTDKPNGLIGLDQKVGGQDRYSPFIYRRRCAIGGEARPNPFMVLTQNVVSPYLSHWVSGP